MKPEKYCEKLARFLTYVLGRSPDEFGLMLDTDGYCKIKTLLQVLSEEDGWKHIRKGNINEIFILLNNHGLELKDDKIRIKDQTHLPKPTPPKQLPKLLYTCVRQRAYSHVFNKGVMPLGGSDYVVMAANEQMAKRMGRRIDSKPVKLIIQTQKLLMNDCIIEQYGEELFLTAYIPFDSFQGPPLPDERKQVKKTKPKEEPAINPHENFGSFFPQPDEQKLKKDSRSKGSKKEIAWKKERRQKKRR